MEHAVDLVYHQLRHGHVLHALAICVIDDKILSEVAKHPSAKPESLGQHKRDAMSPAILVDLYRCETLRVCINNALVLAELRQLIQFNLS